MSILTIYSDHFVQLFARNNDVYINWMDCTMLKKIMPMPDSKIQLSWLLFPTLALFLAPNHDSSPITIIILAILSIANYNFSATAHAGIFQNGKKLAPFSEIRCHSISLSSLYIHCCYEQIIKRSGRKIGLKYSIFLKRANVKLNWVFLLWRESDHTNLLMFWESLVHVKGRQYSDFEK